MSKVDFYEPNSAQAFIDVLVQVNLEQQPATLNCSDYPGVSSSKDNLFCALTLYGTCHGFAEGTITSRSVSRSLNLAKCIQLVNAVH